MSFVPERWYSRPEMVRDKKAFAPFGTGKLLSGAVNIIEV